MIRFQAISLKERQLIGNVALELEVVREDFSNSVRIVSPVEEVREDTSSDNERSDGRDELQEDREDEEVNSLEIIDPFGGFLEHMDEQLNGIESELVTVLRVSALLLGGEEKTKNFKVQQTTELLESIRVIRQRFGLTN